MRKFFSYISTKHVQRRIIMVVIAVITAAAAVFTADIMTGMSSGMNSDGDGTVVQEGELPEAPEITGTKEGEGYIFLKWNPALNADSYLVQRKRKGGRWITIVHLHGHEHCCYADKNPAVGKMRYYRVISVGNIGQRSAPSKTMKLRAHLAVPEIISLSKTTISWEGVEGAQRYYVKKKTSSGSWKSIGRTRSTYFYIGKVGKKTSYVVIAKGADGLRTRSDVFTRRYMNYKGTNMLIEGDSHMFPMFSWAQRSARLLGFTYKSRAINGSTVAGSVNSVYERSTTTNFSGYDIILIRAGSNDYSHDVEIGTADSDDTSTFYGAYSYVLRKIRSEAPDAKIIMVTPTEKGIYKRISNIYAYSYKNDAGYTLDDYREAILNLAAEYGCYVYDMKDCKYITQENLDSSTIDRMHPTNKTHEKISDDFIQFMINTVMKKEVASVDSSTSSVSGQSGTDNSMSYEASSSSGTSDSSDLAVIADAAMRNAIRQTS